MKDKRKVFNDAIDFLTADAPEGGVSMVSVDAITPFRDHPFKLYQGSVLWFLAIVQSLFCYGN